MAGVPQVQQEGKLWSGLATSGTIPEHYKVGGYDELGKLSFLTRGETKFLHLLHTRFPKSKVVETREPKVHEISELSRTFEVTVASSDTYHTQFGIANQKAAELKVNDMLVNTKLYATVLFTDILVAGQVTSAGTNVGPNLGWSVGANPTNVVFSRVFGESNSGTYFVEFEQLSIVAIGANDSAGTGSALITVDRCDMGPAARDRGGARINRSLVNTSITANTADATIAVGDVMLRMLPAFYEGSGAPSGFHKNPEIDVAFIQEFKYAVEATTESEIEKTRIGKKPLDINRWLVTRRMNLDIERSMLFSRKTKEFDSLGNAKYKMGGVLEYIPKDKDHVIKYTQPTMNYNGLLDTTEKCFRNGGGMERFGFCGLRVYTELKKSFYSSGYLRYDPDASKEFDIPVESIIAAGGKINIIPLFSMTEANYDNIMLVLDFTNDPFVPLTNKGWDMRVKRDIAPKDTEIYKESITGMKGLERRYDKDQSVIYFDF